MPKTLSQDINTNFFPSVSNEEKIDFKKKPACDISENIFIEVNDDYSDLVEKKIEECSNSAYSDYLIRILSKFPRRFIKEKVIGYQKNILSSCFDLMSIVLALGDSSVYKVEKIYFEMIDALNDCNKVAKFISFFDHKNDKYNIDIYDLETGGKILTGVAIAISKRLEVLLSDRRFRLGLETYIAGYHLNEVFEELLSNYEDDETLFDLLHPIGFMEKRLYELVENKNASLYDRVRVYFENTDVLMVVENPIYTALPDSLKKDNHWEERKKSSDKNRYFFKEYTIREFMSGYHRYEAAKDSLVTLSDIAPWAAGYHAGELNILSNMDISIEYQSYFVETLKNDTFRSRFKKMIADRVNGIILAELDEYKVVHFEGRVTTGLLVRKIKEGLEFKSLIDGKEYRFESWKEANEVLNEDDGTDLGDINNDFLIYIKMHVLFSQRNIYPKRRRKYILTMNGFYSSELEKVKLEITEDDVICTLDYLYKNIVDNNLEDMDYLSRSDLEISTTYWMSWTKAIFTAMSVAALPFGFIGLIIDSMASIPSIIQAQIADRDEDKLAFATDALKIISIVLAGAAAAKLGAEVVNTIGKARFKNIIEKAAEKISLASISVKIEKILIAETVTSAVDVTVIKNLEALIMADDVLYQIKDYIIDPFDECFNSVTSMAPILKKKGYSVRVGATLCWEHIDDSLPENHFFCVITKNSRDYIVDLTGSQYDFIEQTQGGVRSALVLTKDEWIRRFKEGFNTSDLYQDRAVKYREFANISEAELHFGSASFRRATHYIDEQTFFIKRPFWVYENVKQTIMDGVREVIEEYIPQPLAD
ncbi:hypothetical protein [Iodobacter ciconiae]|nr:hypothetical protein [Iodobacter ciconiae]